MKIAINTRLLLKNNLEGIGWFTYETCSRMAANHPEVKFIYFFDRKYDPSFISSPNIHPAVIYPQARHPLLYYIWFEQSVKRALDKYKPDLFLSPDGYLPLRTRIPSVSVLHDLNFEHYPEDLPVAERFYYRNFFPKYAKKARRIATVSQYSKNDIIEQYGIPDDKIDIVYNGYADSFKPLTGKEIQNSRDKYTGGKPYFIFIGSLHPRKNLINLFKAYDIFRERNSDDVKLLIVGASKWWTTSINETFKAMNFKDDVIFTGRLKTEELVEALGSAIALAYVSYFEGFGIPILEAYASGVPVITSDTTSMPEISAGASLICDPFSTESIAGALTKIYKDEQLRNVLIDKGNERKNDFSWDKTAEALWQCLLKSLD